MTAATGLREQKRRATREAIVRAATTLFLRQGFVATSVSDIAAAAGVSRRTFFLHFPSKEDVLFHHIEGHIQVALDILSRLDPETTAWDATQAAMYALVDAFDVTAANGDELADLRRQFVGSARGLPGSLMIRLQSVHAALLLALEERFPDRTRWPIISTHLGACMGAVTAAAGSDSGTRHSSMRTAISRASEGFRPV
ncbi:TetR/AcrR family transcriptional regulator [Nocardia sp. NBC_01730]|uniref:TetR/AcrR family transcriptional regulator n=1 Tax=Nocardia sp. NBC_01730 TaxID=2975998 RepID=UPI002E12A95B|nr:TetR/AcrR family transcriptional regulator [Nocardia sp. NBC_01730]